MQQKQPSGSTTAVQIIKIYHHRASIREFTFVSRLSGVLIKTVALIYRLIITYQKQKKKIALLDISKTSFP